MAKRENVMEKRGFKSEKQYFEFASQVGHRIDFSRRMNRLAAYYGTSLYNLSQHIGEGASKALLHNGDLLDFAANNTSDPSVVLWAYLEKLGNEGCEDSSTEAQIADQLLPTTERSFRRWSDRNKLTKTINFHWLAPDGMPLDVQAEIIGCEVEELVEFILAHPKGAGTYQTAQQRNLMALENAFKALSGVNLNPRFALQVQREFPEIFSPGQTKDLTDVPF